MKANKVEPGLNSKLKLNDWEIREYISSFIYLDKEGNIKQKKRSFTPFNVPRNSRLKGLHLYQGKDKNGDISKDKFFYVNYRVKGSTKTKWYPLGKFIYGQYGIRQVQDVLTELNKKHTNNSGHWISCPLEAKRKAKTIITNDSAVEKLKQPVSIVIEHFCKEGFPRAKFGGTLTADTIRKRARGLIGYNLRVKHLGYDNDTDGNGYVSFKPNFRTRVVAPKNFEELFKKFPSGHRLITNPVLNPNKCISIYDDPVMSKTFIGDLDKPKINAFIRQFKSHSVKDDVIECFNLLWSFACKENYYGVSPLDNPAYKHKSPRPTRARKRHKYYKKAFTIEMQEQICDMADQFRDRFPFQTELIRLMAVTGLRREEACKIKKENVNYKDDEIMLPAGITKSGNEEFITITDPVKIILEEIETYKKHKEHGDYYRVIPWLLGTTHTKLNKDKLFDQTYRNSSQTRLKTDRNCWRAIRQELGLELCTSKMLRKSYARDTQEKLFGRSDKSIRLTRHSTTDIFDKAYDGAEREAIKNDAREVAKMFTFIKRKKVS